MNNSTNVVKFVVFLRHQDSMKRFGNIIISLFLLVWSPFPASGQGLPSLEKASELSTGELPNGVSYYLVSNTTSKGYANFALVQKEDADVDACRDHLKALPHFSNPSPYRFLSSRGVGYRRYGYISYPDNSSLYCFEDVPVFDSAASDSTLLLLFDLIQTSGAPQAIIISGDISNLGLSDKIRMLALTTMGQRPAYEGYQGREWKPNDKIRFVHTQNSTKDVAGVQVVYSSPRPSKEYMNTAQPLVTRMYSIILGSILQKRAWKAFFDQGIPLADTYFRYTSGSESSGDEKYRFAVYTSKENLSKATSILAGLLAEMDVHGASASEFQEARTRLVAQASSAAALSNAAWVKKCVSSFLYGSDLASNATAAAFFKDRKINEAKDLELFNRFASAIIDPQKGLTLNIQTPDREVPKDSLMASFTHGWEASGTPPEEIYGTPLSDTLRLYTPRGRKVKIKSETTDPITGGKLWTFGNGMRVIYKDTGVKGPVHYAFMINGGVPEVPELQRGESAFAPDMAQAFNIAGLSPVEFRNMLRNNGVYYKLDMTLTDLRITGTAPSEKVPLLLKSILSYDKLRTQGPEYLPYYKACEYYRQQRARLTQAGVKAAIDSIISPDFVYLRTKDLSNLRDDLHDKVDFYLTERFANADDGIIVLVGHLNEDELKSTLCKYLGHFTTSGKKINRPAISYDPRKGWFTYTVEAAHSNVGTGDSSVNLALAAQRPFSMRSYLAFRMAAIAIKNALVEKMATAGYTIDLSTDVQIFPSEMFSLLVNCRPCLEQGLPSGIKPTDPMSALSAVRSGIYNVSSKGISSSELKAYRATLVNDLKSEYGTPESLIYATLLRYSEGRDIVSNFEQNVNSVSVDDVLSTLKALDAGCKVEYVIK